jgi:hypothetical protein
MTYFKLLLDASIISAMIALMMEASSTFETSVKFYQTTRRNIPENSHLQGNRLVEFILQQMRIII